MWTLIFVYSLYGSYIPHTTGNKAEISHPVTVTKDFKTKQGCEFVQKWLEQNTVNNRKRIDVSICIKGE